MPTGKSCLIRSLTVKRVVDSFPLCFLYRAVAQTGSAFAWGAKGQEFKSPRPDHFKPHSDTDSIGRSEVFSLMMSIRSCKAFQDLLLAEGHRDMHR